MRTWWRLSTADGAAGAAVALLLAGAPAVGARSDQPAPPSLAPDVERALRAEALAGEQGGRPLAVRAATAAATRPPRAEDGVFLPWLEPGTLLGLLHAPRGARDARGEEVPAGHYTLRYAVQPRLKDHVEVSPYRDFALLVPARRDRGGSIRASELMALARPAAGRHPYVLALSPPPGCAGHGLVLPLGPDRACLRLNE
jgi:hypothetical protein